MFFLIEVLLQFIIGIVEIFLVLRLLFKFFGANASSPFVGWLYQITQPLLYPFRNIFPAPQIEGKYLLEFTTLAAIIVYLLFAFILLQLVGRIRRIRRGAEDADKS